MGLDGCCVSEIAAAQAILKVCHTRSWHLEAKTGIPLLLNEVMSLWLRDWECSS